MPIDRSVRLRELAQQWNEAWNSRDVARLTAFFLPDATYYEPELDVGLVRAVEGLPAIAQRTWSEWPEASFVVVTMTIEDPRVVVEWRSSATHRSGKLLNLEGVDILEWHGDKLASARVYYDVHARVLALS
jgi:steroid delta-isomerase-like uncharacterized protein